MSIKLYGYKDEGLPVEEIDPQELAEVTLVASPDELRKIAHFLQATAERMEKMGKNYSHEHLSDEEPGFKDSPHFVVANPEGMW